MKFFGARGRPSKPETEPLQRRRDKLPAIHAFIELRFADGSCGQSVSVNEVTSAELITRSPKNVSAGMPVDFSYVTSAGRFRFSTTCSRVDGDEAHFPLPDAIKSIELFAARRGSPRVKKLMPVQWRYAPDRQGYGDYLVGSLMDLSYRGASLVVTRELKIGELVEVRFTLDPKEKPLVELSEVVRASKIETSGRNVAGIRFVELSRQDERALVKFLDELQTTRRDRGVV